MQYLHHVSHLPPPDHLAVDGSWFSPQSLIESAAAGDEQAKETLAAAGYFPHHFLENADARILGSYWTFEFDAYFEAPEGSEEDRAVALAERRAQDVIDARNALEVDAWKGKMVLAMMPALTDGPLALLPGPTLLHQVRAFCATNLSPSEYERFDGTLTWKRNDPQLAALIPLTGLSEEEVDEWFAAAKAVE